MRRWPLPWATAALLALAGTLAPAAPGHASPAPVATPAATPAAAAQPTAAGQGRVSGVQIDETTVEFVLTATDLDRGDTMDPGSVRASLGGAPLEVSAAPLEQGTQTRVRRTAVLAIDLSGSMGDDLAAAKEAATTFAESVPDDVSIGLVTFNEQVETLVQPTRDRDRLTAAIDGLRTRIETRLYDGVLEAVAVAGDSGDRTVVVLSDGQDTASDATHSDVTAALEAGDVRVDVVPLGTNERLRPILAEVTEAGGGRLIEAPTRADLAAAFEEAAATIAAQLLVTAPLPAALAEQAGDTVTLVVGAEVAGEPVEAAATVPLPVVLQAPGPVPVVADRRAWSDAWLVAGAAALFVGLAVLVGTALVSTAGGTRPETRVLRRMSLYTLTGRGPRRQETVTSFGRSTIARSAVELAGRVVARRDYEIRLMRRLEAAGIPVRPAEWVILHTASVFGAGLLFLLLGGGSALMLLLGLLVGGVAPVLYVSTKRSRRQAAFSSQLAETLMLIAGSLGAGYSLPQAVDAVVREGREPMATELNRALVENRLGVPLEDALQNLAERMHSRDFTWVVMAMRIQRDVGGNLADVLRSVAETLRERDFLRRQVTALSAEGRLSALVLSLLPPFFVIYLALVRPEYVGVLFGDVVGLAMVVLAVTLLVVGLLWMRRIIRVEV